jgi:CRISPR/Cas system-associated exonuclease Cas4 (RecB family)
MDRDIIALSPSTLNLFIECPRCFWLHMNKNIKRPRGIFPSLPSGMDIVIKKYFDIYRVKKTLPPELFNKIEGRLLENQILLNKWRNWRTGLTYIDTEKGAKLYGALDDCIVDKDFYIPLDYKTSSSTPTEIECEKYYGNQLSCYNLLLAENGYKTTDFGYLIYYSPKNVREDGIVEFEIKLMKVNTDIQKAKKTFYDAINLLLQDKIPAVNPECEYCNYLLTDINKYNTLF